MADGIHPMDRHQSEFQPVIHPVDILEPEFQPINKNSSFSNITFYDIFSAQNPTVFKILSNCSLTVEIFREVN